VSEVNGRLAGILDEYIRTTADIERPAPTPHRSRERTVLLPADQQRGYVTADDRAYGLSSEITLSSMSTGSASGSGSSVFGRAASGSEKSR
jgi:hypothetical protein